MPAFLWTQKEDIGPSPRYGHAMCYDTARQRTLLFGGLAQAPFGDSWTWSGQNWTQVADTGPSPRFDHAMCFDSTRNLALLFGGRTGAALRGDSWSWNGEYWTQVEDTGPEARDGHGMVFDKGRSRIVLFGGNAAGMMRDTWEWDGEAWTQVEDAGPPARTNHGMAYDLVRQRTLLFGGEDATGATFSDTWEWDGNAWTQVEDIGPPSCTGPALVSTDAQLVLFGGASSSVADPPPTLFDDSWVLINGQWTQKQDMGPAGRWGHAMAFDTQRRTIVLFGGLSNLTIDNPQDLRRDTWELLETEASAVGPDPNAPQPNLIEFYLDPTTATAGQTVWAHMVINPPAVDGTVVQLFYAPLSTVDMTDPNNPNFAGAQVEQLGAFPIPPGNNMFSEQFAAPPVGESVLVIATLDMMTLRFAELAIS